MPLEMPCPNCGASTHYKKALVTMWLGAELNVIDDVPAYVCDGCAQQFYEPEVEEEIRALVAQGFPSRKATHHISVPVFKLEGSRAAIDPAAVARQIQNSREVPQS